MTFFGEEYHKNDARMRDVSGGQGLEKLRAPKTAPRALPIYRDMGSLGDKITNFFDPLIIIITYYYQPIALHCNLLSNKLPC